MKGYSDMNSKQLFAATPPVKLFLTAAIPGAISMLASALYQMFDGAFVGGYVGYTAFASLNLAMPFVIINFALADLIGVGSAVPVSICLGRKQTKEANNIFTCACLLIFLTGIISGAVIYAAAPLLIELMGADGEFAKLAVEYLRVYALFSPVTTIVFAMDNFWRICGFIRGSMFLNLLMSFLSAGLEFIFLGVLDLGIRAAATATCLGMFVCALTAFIPFLRGRATLRLCVPRLNFYILKKIVTCGFPNFLNNIAGRIASILFNLVLVRLGGETAVSVYGVLMYAEGFILPLLYGTCDSLQPAVGFNWGAGKFSRVRAIERCCFTFSAILSLLAVVFISVFPEQIAVLFVPDGGDSYKQMATGALRIFAFTYITRWFSFAVQSYMLAIEKPLPASLISFATALVFPALLLAVFWPLGLTGIWLNFAVTALLAAALSAVIMLKYRRELNRDDSLSPD